MVNEVVEAAICWGLFLLKFLAFEDAAKTMV
jgi:hypothetical protein